MSVPAPAQRKLEVEIGPKGPWRAMIRVHAVSTNHGRKTLLPHDHLFEITAEWHGPPAAYMPPSERPVDGSDLYVVERLEDARTIANKAAEAFGRGGDTPPDLRQLAGK